MASDLFRRGAVIENTGAVLSDWKGIIDSGERIRKAVSISNTTGTLYTVPAGKVFYLVSVFLSWTNTATVTGSRAATLTLIDKDSQGLNLIDFDVSFTDEEHDNQSLSFTIPLLMVATEFLRAQSGNANTIVNATIQGYEVDA